MNEDFSYYNGEGTILRKAQLRVLDILVEVDKICKKHDIDYWIIGGTLLGAVRHQGFVPWDYDGDISIRHSDLSKLRKFLIEDLPHQFFVQDKISDDQYYIDSVIKIRDKNSLIPFDSHASFKEKGLFIDIIPMEKIPSMKFKRFVFKCNKDVYLRSKEYSLTGKSSNIRGALYAPFVSILVKAAHFYSNISRTNIYGYNYLFSMTPFFEMQFPENIIFPLKTIKFEGYDLKAPNDIDKYLNLSFGDYMRIPSPENRQVHNSYIEIYDKN